MSLAQKIARAFTPEPRKHRCWGQNDDGTPYVTGLTVGELRKALEGFADTDEVLMSVSSRKYWNGGGLLGKLKELERGVDGQMWLKALVLDESLED